MLSVIHNILAWRCTPNLSVRLSPPRTKREVAQKISLPSKAKQLREVSNAMDPLHMANQLQKLDCHLFGTDIYNMDIGIEMLPLSVLFVAHQVIVVVLHLHHLLMMMPLLRSHGAREVPETFLSVLLPSIFGVLYPKNIPPKRDHTHKPPQVPLGHILVYQTVAPLSSIQHGPMPNSLLYDHELPLVSPTSETLEG